MNLTHTFIKTATACAIAGTFGLAHAQYEELTQIQQPSSTATRLNHGNMSDRRDDTVRQTQQANSSSGAMQSAAPMDRRDETVTQTQPPLPGGATAGASMASTDNSRPMITNDSGTLQPHMNNRADMQMRNDGMRMQGERTARVDRN